MEIRRDVNENDRQNGVFVPPAASSPAVGHGTHKSKRVSGLKRPQGKMLLWVLTVLLLAAAVGTSAYYVNRYNDSQQQVKKLSSNPTITAQQQQQQLIERVGKLTVLPKDEVPTVATVTDITKLKDQPFFVNAQNNDRVLIYTQAKEAFLYRPSTNKLINIAPVNLGTGQSPATTSTTKKP